MQRVEELTMSRLGKFSQILPNAYLAGQNPVCHNHARHTCGVEHIKFLWNYLCSSASYVTHFNAGLLD